MKIEEILLAVTRKITPRIHSQRSPVGASARGWRPALAEVFLILFCDFYVAFSFSLCFFLSFFLSLSFLAPSLLLSLYLDLATFFLSTHSSIRAHVFFSSSLPPLLRSFVSLFPPFLFSLHISSSPPRPSFPPFSPPRPSSPPRPWERQSQ